MVEETFLQHWIVTKFALPFLLVFFIVFAVLEKTKIFGDGQKQIDALISFIIALIFVGAIYPKIVVANLILFLTVALVVVFVVLILWGFVFGDIKEGFKPDKWMKLVLGILIAVAVLIAVFWATGIEWSVFSFLFQQSWSGALWINVFFVVVIAAALALILKSKK